ncbi:MAG: hypothetical protein AAFZ18_32555, partial [Myxococcota bacterium]
MPTTRSLSRPPLPLSKALGASLLGLGLLVGCSDDDPAVDLGMAPSEDAGSTPAPDAGTAPDLDAGTSDAGSTADTTPPTVTITDSAGGAATGDVTFTFAFSENVGTSFAIEDVTVEGGAAGAFAVASEVLANAAQMQCAGEIEELET